MLSKTNNVTHKKEFDLLSQENQDYNNQHDQQFIARKHDGGQGYYNQSDQQFIARKYDGGLERVTIDLVPDIILEEEDVFARSGLTSIISGVINPTRLQKEMKLGALIHLMLTTVFSTLPKPNITGN